MERIVAFSLSNFSTIIILSSLAWMFLRAYQVLSKPSQDLIDLLGIEVPQPPALALHGIKADGVIVNWKAPDLQKPSTIKYSLWVNGINVSELSPVETSIAVTDLRPSSNYIIRVVASNALNFEAKSEPIRVQTRDAASKDFFRKRESQEQDAESSASQAILQPCIRTYKSLIDLPLPAPSAPAMNREHSGSISQQQQKKAGGRRVSAAASQEKDGKEVARAEESEDIVQELTAKLDKLYMEIDQANEEIVKEEEEFAKQQEHLTELRSSLKQQVAEKEHATKLLNKQVKDLSNQNSAAQAKKVAADKRLQSRQGDRQKLKEDIAKWEEEIKIFRTETTHLHQEKLGIETEMAAELQRLRHELTEEQAATKAMEEEVKRARSEIKELEQQKERLEQEGSDEVHGPVPIRQGSDLDWMQRLNRLQYDYRMALENAQKARAFANEAQGRAQEWEQRRLAEPHMFLSQPIEEYLPQRRNSSRRSRTLSLRDTSHHAQGSPYDPPSYSAAMSTVSPAFASISPFFNIMNGAPLVQDHMINMTPSEIEQLTGGAPTSPSVAGALLPAGLLGDDEPSRSLSNMDSGSSRSSPMAANALPGLGAPQTLEQINNRDPASPNSNPSRSPSVFASPRESTTHLPFSYAAEGLFDSDRRSIRSTTSSLRNPGAIGTTGTKFAHIFNFNRARVKAASADEGPALGSLRSSESQSFPRQDLAELSSAGRRRGSHSGGGGWREQIQNSFSKSTNKEQIAEPSIPKRKFVLFGSRTGEAPGSPRPGSTASSENQLPKPSAEGASRFGWGMPGDPFNQRGSHLASADWSLAPGSSWSRQPSRRPSIHGQVPSFMEDSFVEDDDDMAPPRRRSPKLAPIGTRPTSQISANSLEKPRLNPAAPSFKIQLFNREKKEEGDRAEKPSKKGKSKKADRTGAESPALIETPASPQAAETRNDLSPPDSRFSKDGALSISTLDTASEPRTSLERTPSRASEAYGKESFMQKLSRKSSASMFTFPRFTSSAKKTGPSTSSQLATSNSAEFVGTTPDETDEEGKLSPMIGSKEKFSFRRSLTGRRKGEKAPSIQESLTSETGDEETEEEGEIPNSRTGASLPA